MTATPHLRPHHPDDLADLLAFIHAHPAADLDDTLLRELLTRLPRSTAHVLDLHLGADRLLVATVVDTLANASDAALLALLALRDHPATAQALTLALTHAEQLAGHGPRRRLEIALPSRLRTYAPQLEQRGYTVAFRQYHMLRPTADLAPAPALPAAFRWIDATPDDIPAYHALVARAFAGIPGTHLADLDTFRAMFERNPRRPRLLLHHERPVGFVKTSLDPDGITGLVHILGRDPDVRGHQLGPALLHEAMRVLAHAGARRFRLEVIAHNHRALDLYLRHGFEVSADEPTYQRDLPAHA